jgi:hypothetical protein
MIIDDERLHELGSLDFPTRTRPTSEIAERARRLRRRRTATATGVSVVSVVCVVLLGSVLAAGLPEVGASGAPASGTTDDGTTHTRVFLEPRPGETPTLRSLPPQFPRVKAVAPPYTVAYEDVPLHLPGRPESCEESFYLRLQVPEVNNELVLSDAMLSEWCAKPPLHELQAGGVAIQDTDPTAQECATALESLPSSHAFKARVGWTLCVISQAHWPATEPKLVALRVTSVNETTGAFDLSATAWTGTGVPE